MDTLDLLTVTQAAAMLGISGQALRKRIARGHMHAHRLGRDWVITPEELARVQALGTLRPGPQPGTGGRPRKIDRPAQ